MNGARFILESLRRHGIETVFGYPGGAIMPLYDAMALMPHGPTHILTRHEQAAGFAANGYARASGRLGVCIATSGPGATNLITAVADAHMDSVPMLVITGQVASPLIGTDAFQETDVLGLSLPITKHSYLIETADELPAILDEAIDLALDGRPGPVWVDIPKDVLLAPVNAARAAPDHRPSAPHQADDGVIGQAIELLRNAERPVVYAGGGVVLADAVPALRDFVAVTGLPVVTTLKGIGLLPADHPDNLGMIGMHGTACANRATQAADLLVVVGARFDDRATGRIDAFAPGARVIHLDADAAEIGKLRRADVALHGDLAHSLARLARPLCIGPWQAACRAARHSEMAEQSAANGEGFSAQHFLRGLSERAGRDTVIACDVGQHQMWVAQHYGFHDPRQHLTSGGLGAMGFGLPAAIGAQFAHPEARVINISGDGSFLMNVQELATVRRHALPLKIVILDNQYLGMVRQQQTLFYGGRLSAVDLSDNPDFVEVARAFGIPARRVEGCGAQAAAIDACLHIEGPLLLHIPIARTGDVWPFVPPGQANDHMLTETAR